MKESVNYNFRYVLFISCVAAIGGFLFGYDSAVINGTIGAIKIAFGSSSVGSGFSVASMLLGCAFGALNAGSWADKIGRRPIMKMAAIAFIISAWGSGAATSANFFIVFRLLGGIAVGAASVVAPLYISEIAPAKIRGRLASLQQMAIVVGIFVAFITNFLIAKSAGGVGKSYWLGFAAWKWMFWAEGIPAFAYLIFSFIVPESPRYLIASGQKKASKLILLKVWANEQFVNHEIEIIQRTVNTEHQSKFSDIFPNGKLLPIVWIGLVLSVFQQFVGINVVFYYGAVLWESAGFSESDALLINIISGTVNIVSTIVAISLIDKIGRKPLLLFGSIGMALTLGSLALIFSMAGVDQQGNLDLTGNFGTLALIAANVYVFCFGVSWGPVVWVLLGEMFTNKIRGHSIALAAGAQWLANFMITISFPIILESTGLFGAYGIYAFFAFVSIFFVFKYVRETKGKTLEEM
ncbi:MAG: SP family sugar:H+ symporter-like MFS transporter [Dokdonia sp.]|jgi:SP family sugar:H+ symporter-like MFS transporter